jgi:hypothetical protein
MFSAYFDGKSSAQQGLSRDKTSPGLQYLLFFPIDREMSVTCRMIGCAGRKPQGGQSAQNRRPIVIWQQMKPGRTRLFGYSFPFPNSEKNSDGIHPHSRRAHP